MIPGVSQSVMRGAIRKSPAAGAAYSVRSESG
jgi:hypothetical protein